MKHVLIILILFSAGCQGGKHHVSFKEWTTIALHDVKESFDPTIRDVHDPSFGPWAQYRNDRKMGLVLPLYMYGIDEFKYNLERQHNPHQRKLIFDHDLLIWRPQGVNEGYWE